ncbi:N-glycosidase YbiA [Andreprevotia sp. IGB-42]|uniref:NADAR family protein n=1 Tax=Andreprevotia sp. IGB-42 TaxID=2497473 RepID=UPI00135C0EC5|nr:NADAR family protein [Andreprevotia sp. IGB-42]KAF0814963.1 N-glycosidase YbiA [Andreprevotia sp. IGB-42]
MNTINFYTVEAPYGCFSNFAPYPIMLDGLTWPTSEHYFQAAKLIHAADKAAVHQAPTPFLAAQIGRERTRPILPDWNQVKDGVMATALAAKFVQHPAIGEILLSTGDALLVEHTVNDAYWGDGGDGRGRNRLGYLLMDLRGSTQAQSQPFFAPPWLVFPGIEVSDLHWRMGEGEGYLMRAARWRSALSPVARREYDLYYPVPEAWSGSW